MSQINTAPSLAKYPLVQRIFEDSKRGGEPKSEEYEPSLTSEQVADRLTRSSNRWPDSNRNGTAEMTFEFSTAEPGLFAEVKDHDKKQAIKEFLPLTPRQQAFVRKAQQEYSDVANITFTEAPRGSGEGHLTYNGYSTGDQPSGVRGFAFMRKPQNEQHQGAVWMRHVDQESDFGGYDDNAGEDAWRQNFTHELGHGLGLEHPFSDKDEKPELADYGENWSNYTVMSNNSASLSDNEEEDVRPVSLMVDDVTAIQSLYGANYATRSGDTTYGFNSNTERDHLSLKTAEDKPTFTVWDGGGWDTLDFSKFSQNQTINLNAGSFSQVGGLLNNVSIAHGVTIEEAKGGKGKNILIGNNAFNVLRGGPNSDILFGGSGGAQMWGGKGANTFVFDTSSSGKANWVMDFTSGKDKLDFSGLRQQLGPLNFVSTLPHDHSKAQDPLSPTFITRPGDVLVTYDAAFQRTHFRIDTTGNGKMDMHIDVQGSVAREDVVV